MNDTAEQKARDMLERMGVENAQSFSSGDLVELANLIASAETVDGSTESRSMKLLTNITVHNSAIDPKYREVMIGFKDEYYMFTFPHDCYPDELALLLRDAAKWLAGLV